MDCSKCPLRVDCLTEEGSCDIVSIEDYDLEPHPSQITFNLADVTVDMIGGQLSLWVDERTFRALMKLRPQFTAVHISPEEVQGYWDPGVDGPGLCISVKGR